MRSDNNKGLQHSQDKPPLLSNKIHLSLQFGHTIQPTYLDFTLQIEGKDLIMHYLGHE